MAEATTETMLAMFPELTSVSSGTIQLYLDDAKAVIEDVDTSHAQYSLLQRLQAAHLLSVSGIMKGPVTGEHVDSVGLSYAAGNNSGTDYADAYERKYYQLLENIAGPDRRFY